MPRKIGSTSMCVCVCTLRSSQFYEASRWWSCLNHVIRKTCSDATAIGIPARFRLRTTPRDMSSSQTGHCYGGID
eukprot:gene26693-biopygen4559